MIQDDDGGGEAAELDLDNVGGVFVVLLIGASFACFIALIELLWEIYKKDEKARLLSFSLFCGIFSSVYYFECERVLRD